MAEIKLKRFNNKSEKKFSRISDEEFFRLTKLDPDEWRRIL